MTNSERTNARYDFGELPIWKGVQSRPGYQAAGFALKLHPSGHATQASPQTQSLMHEAYAKAEYTFITNPPGASPWANRIGDAYFKRFDQMRPVFNNSRVVEIGAGSAYIAKHALQAYDIDSYTIVDPAVRESSDDPRLTVLQDYFHPETFPAESFDWALSFNCLEHVPDALSFLHTVQAALKPMGMLFFVFPDIEEQFARGDVGALLHEHISYFTRDSAERLFVQAGFSVEMIDSRADELTVLARKCAVQATPGRVDMAHAIGGTDLLPASFDHMTRNVATYREKIRADLHSGRKVAFQGANNGLNNFLFMTGLGDSTNLAIFDGDQSKAGRFLGCSPHFIRHSEDPFYKDMDSVYVTASTFFPEIRKFLVAQHGIADSAIQSVFGTPSRSSSI